MSGPKPAGGDITTKRALVAPLFPYHEFISRTAWTARWCRAVKQTDCPRFGTPAELYLYLQREFIKDSPIDYLEFGVASGISMRAWSGMNRQPASRLMGFDSFLGLPEDWNRTSKKGTFNRNGMPPEIPDSRIKFHVGWFQDTVPGFLASYSPANRVVIHNDSDLYSSTLYTLTMLDRFISPETIVIFDEFNDVLHEYRALVDYSTAYRKTFRIIGATQRFVQAAVVFSDQS